MANAKVTWAQMPGSKWSGPQVKGTRPFTPVLKNPTEGDVINYAVASPEGGAFDTVGAYDGTAMTFGLFQWTLTSTRLQLLLNEIGYQASAVFLKTVGILFDKMDVILLDDGKLHYDGGTNKVLDTAALRATFTPPNGTVPRSGPAWDTAKEAAAAFWQLGQYPEIDKIQLDFFERELNSESQLRRPKLNDRTIASILYPYLDVIHSNMALANEWTPVRALMWAMWQNAPREAEKCLNKVVFDKNTIRECTLKLARQFASSQYGNWGVMKAALCKKCGYQNVPVSTKCQKCGAPLRTCRYVKVARCINKQMGANTLPLIP